MAIPTPIKFDDDSSAAPVEKSYDLNHGKVVDLTPEAVAYIKEFTANNPDKLQNKQFKVYVEGGGCSGLQYGFTFASQSPDDFVIPCSGIEILVDKMAEPYLKGSVVDYVSGLQGNGFVVKNPQSKGECGCGISFNV